MAQFKARARTLDMLGRQQIANVSTAISELFKNAYDAYADNVEVDYFKSDKLLVIRDNGIGMTPEEFEDRWLVLGTESKLASDKKKAVAYRPPKKDVRPVMGEKGIGRLAIALLGRQVLVLTRAERDGSQHDLVMCFIHWGLFEIPSVNLDEVEIPIKLILGDRLPTSDEVEELMAGVKQNVHKLAERYGQDRFKDVLRDLDAVQLDPQDLGEFLDSPTLKGTGGGTHFLICQANESIEHDIERELNSNGNKKDFSKFLLGFSNFIFRDPPSHSIEVAFRYWSTDDDPEDLIGEGEFFTKEELKSADHRISGKFDEFGQFQGSIKIYNEDIDDYVIPWTGGDGNRTNCGPFEIEFGYVPGLQRESKLPPDEWKRITDKLNNIGGIYVYRDSIRILPYGNSDVDWLDIEMRRTKGAGYYVFSHRRMFGAVILTRECNGSLKEKAGREGFRADKAYRQMKDILENLFIQLAADFFREDGDYTDLYHTQRGEIERLDLARRHHEKQSTGKRKDMEASLNGFFNRVKEGTHESDLSNLRGTVRQSMESAAKIENPDEASVALLDAEKKANKSLSKVKARYRLDKPRGLGLSRQLQQDWNAYLTEFARLEEAFFEPFGREINETLELVAVETNLHVDQKRRFRSLISQQAENEKSLVDREVKKLKASASNARSTAMKLARNAIDDLQKTVSDVQAEFDRENLAVLSEELIGDLRERLESKIEEVGRKNIATLSKVRDMLLAVSGSLEEGADIVELDIVEAIDQELQELREQSDADAELVQLGLAVAVINHEFDAAIKGIRRSLRKLKPWAESNKDLYNLYAEIRNNFDHLDGHLNLFTPLQRRLYRKKISIKGTDISHYISALFDVRLSRHNIRLHVTKAFRDSEVVGFPSTLYPVFVNVIDNAIFWLGGVKDSKTITLDAKDSYFLVSNNGPAVHKRDHDSIFEQGFTRKPGGRGLGLFISKRALQKEGMDIGVVPSDDKRGTTMRIRWPNHD